MLCLTRVTSYLLAWADTLQPLEDAAPPGGARPPPEPAPGGAAGGASHFDMASGLLDMMAPKRATIGYARDDLATQAARVEAKHRQAAREEGRSGAFLVWGDAHEGGDGGS